MADDIDATTEDSRKKKQERDAAGNKAVQDFIRAAAGACETLLGLTVTDVELPGGQRKSLRVRCGKQSVIVTRRPNLKRARLEVSVLYALGSHGGAVPKVLAFDGIWLIQEDLGERRLSRAIAAADAATAETWIDAGVSSIAANQNAATACGYERNVITLGTDPQWLSTVITMPDRVGQMLGVAPPALPEEALAQMLRVRRPYFVKWDARPGNAMTRENGTVVWFDWEHSGCRNRFDDLVWFLADEYMPDRAAIEKKVLARHMESFAQGMESKDEAAEYFYTFGTLHSCVRLSLILASKEAGPWWDPEKVLASDKVGVTRAASLACLGRASRWAAQAPLVAPLLPWLEQLPERLPPDNRRA